MISVRRLVGSGSVRGRVVAAGLALLLLALVGHAVLVPRSRPSARPGPAAPSHAQSTIPPFGAPTGSHPVPLPTPTAPPGGYRQVVARMDLPAVTVLTATGSIAASFAEAALSGPPPAGAFASLDALAAYVRSGHGGRYTTARLFAGTPPRRAMLGDMGGRVLGSVALRLPGGRVAESVVVPALQSANAGIVAGDLVDVLLTLSTDQLYSFRAAGQPAGPQETGQILQDVPVVAVAPPVYTLALRLQDALLLKYVKDSANATVELVPLSGLDAASFPARTVPILPEYVTGGAGARFLRPRLPGASPLAAGVKRR